VPLNKGVKFNDVKFGTDILWSFLRYCYLVRLKGILHEDSSVIFAISLSLSVYYV